MTRPSARWLALLAATVIVLYLCWLMLAPFADVLLWASVLAIVAWPFHARLRRGGWSASSGAMLTTALVVLTVLIPFTLVTTAVIKQGADAVQNLHEGASALRGTSLYQWLDARFDLDPLQDPKALAARMSTAWGTVANRTLGLVGGLLGGVVHVFFALFTLYYLLRDSERVIPAIRAALPLTREQADVMFTRTGEVIYASVNGVLVIAAIQGTLGMIAFMVLGLPSALLWGVVMFLLSTIPMAGAAIIWVPAAIFLASTGHYLKAAFLAAWGMFVIGLIDNFLRPRLVGKRAKLHELIIFFSVLGGLQVFGVLGLFVGPVVAAIALALVEVFRRSEAGLAAVSDATERVVAVPAGEVSGLTPPPGVPVPESVPAPDRSDGSGR